GGNAGWRPAAGRRSHGTRWRWRWSRCDLADPAHAGLRRARSGRREGGPLARERFTLPRRSDRAARHGGHARSRHRAGAGVAGKLAVIVDLLVQDGRVLRRCSLPVTQIVVRQNNGTPVIVAFETGPERTQVLARIGDEDFNKQLRSVCNEDPPICDVLSLPKP